MHFKKLMVVGTAALAVLGSVTGAALASSRGAKAPAKPAISVPKATDTDNIQEGDQNTPDNPSVAPEAGAVATAAVKGSNPKAGTTPSESGSEGSGESESSGESDGPGGHEDPPGDVQHDFNGEE